MTTDRPLISARTLALLADPSRLRRLRVAYRDRPEVYTDLVTIAAVVLAQQSSGDVDVTDVGITVDTPTASEMSTADAAAQLGISAHAVRVAAQRGRLDGVKRAGRWWITTDAVAQYRAA